jgi:hypothetical protein
MIELLYHFLKKCTIKNPHRKLGGDWLFYKVINYLFSLIAARGAVHRAMRISFKTVLKSTMPMQSLIFYAVFSCFIPLNLGIQ